MSSYGFVELERAECEHLLTTQTVGRVGLGGERPIVLPVVYTMFEGDIVFRTAPGAKLIAAALHATVAFEVDDLDERAREGWNVDVIGELEEIVHRDVLARVQALDLPVWSTEVRDRFVRIRAEEITGRRLVGTVS
jgi:nitroimidazol reductase NimA-like FMN-containing flavoprotein (pyridoxamine 5'-phosphate oxidase superfamily)